jgi:hypothetical protein
VEASNRVGLPAKALRARAGRLTPEVRAEAAGAEAKSLCREAADLAFRLEIPIFASRFQAVRIALLPLAPAHSI